MAGPPCKSEVSLPNFKLDSKLLLRIPNSNLVLPNGIDLANEVLDLRDLTDRYWRVIQAQHVRIARLESELLCAKTAKR
jgi:hypothetical protein